MAAADANVLKISNLEDILTMFTTQKKGVLTCNGCNRSFFSKIITCEYCRELFYCSDSCAHRDIISHKLSCKRDYSENLKKQHNDMLQLINKLMNIFIEKEDNMGFCHVVFDKEKDLPKLNYQLSWVPVKRTEIHELSRIIRLTLIRNEIERTVVNGEPSAYHAIFDCKETGTQQSLSFFKV